MNSVAAVMRNTVPITQFNRGLASKIFDEVKTHGAKVVMKNNSPECVLVSPEEYLEMIDEINDARLLTIASERLAHCDPAKVIPEEKVWERLNITDEELDAVGEVEFE